MMLAACVPAPPPAATTPTPSASAPSPSPTPTEALVTVTILGDGIAATDSAGTDLLDLDYFAAKDDAVAALGALFEFEPTVSVVERAPSDGFAGTLYDWEGFTLYWYGFEDEPGSERAPSPLFAPLRVVVTTAEVRGIVVQGPSDVKVGDPAAALEATYPTQSSRFTGEDGTVSSHTSFGLIPLPPMEGNEDGNTYFFGVSAAADIADGPITLLTAPASVGFGL